MGTVVGHVRKEVEVGAASGLQAETVVVEHHDGERKPEGGVCTANWVGDAGKQSKI